MCSPSSLDCVGRVTVPDGECLENCQGSIMGVERLDADTVSNEEGLARIISDLIRASAKAKKTCLP